jgi:hypothetical protein
VQRFCERGVATPGSGIVISWSAIPEFDQWVLHGGPARRPPEVYFDVRQFHSTDTSHLLVGESVGEASQHGRMDEDL